MLNGKDFGKALGEAIDLKISSGAAKTKAEIARHFDMQPPSLSDWVKKGSVSKDKLSEIWRYFSDVAGYDHWGMTRGEWPLELSIDAKGELVESYPLRSEQGFFPPKSIHSSNEQAAYDPIVDDLAKLPEQVAMAWRQRIASEANFYEATNNHGPKTPDDRRLDPDRRRSNGGRQR